MSAWWAHAQTVTAALPFSRPRPRGVREAISHIPIPEGGVLVLACTFQPRPAPAIVVMHGVSGSSEDPYVVRAGRAFARAGYHVARYNQRGSGLGMGKALRLGHAGLGEDLELVVQSLSVRADVTSIGAVGFSLGGHVALSFAADAGADGARLKKLRAVAAISAPVDLEESTRALDRLRAGRLTRVYEKRIVTSLIVRARALAAAGHALAFDLAELARTTTLRAFDELVTCPSHGFVDTADYYARASVGPRLAHIAVPTLALHAADDPMVPATALQALHAASRVGPSVDVVILPTGGHVGFVEGIAQLWDATAAVQRALQHMRKHL
jgi:predicted alpha/beta-fold hydrolase